MASAGGGRGHATVSGGDPSAGRNLRNVWTINPQPFSGAHYATFPEALVEPCIKAGTSERGQCPDCGSPWVRVIERTAEENPTFKGSKFDAGKTGARDGGDRTQEGPRFVSRTTGWRPSCSCPGLDGDAPGSACNDAANWPTVPQIVLDPFGGSGTVGQVAYRMGRDYILCELNPDYLPHIDKRMDAEAMPLFAAETPTNASESNL